MPFIVKDHPLSSSTPTSNKNGGSASHDTLHSGEVDRSVASPSSAHTDRSFTDESLDGANDDMESLLPQQPSSKRDGTRNGNANGGESTGEAQANATRRPLSTPLEIHMHDHVDGEGKSYLWGLIRPYQVGNMTILFPEYFHSSGWGVVGPHSFGPACVWLIIVGSSHLCIQSVYRHELGIGSVIICYLFMALSTYRLTDVSLRDPGICLDKDIPATVVGTDRAGQYRFCDRCQCWQPPDGIHCPECEVCVAGYDHHCVWMGTCIGKKNYRQFVLFNMSWLYYVGYAFFWLLTFGPLIMKK